MLMHMTRGNGASKEIIKPGSATLAEEEKAEIASLRKLIGPEEGSLDLRSSKLEVIPRPFYKVPFNNLSDLDIRGNEITAIEDAVCINLAQLRKLDARANRIREVSPHIKAMMSLQVLRLDGNLLEDLPCEIGELSYLEELTFAENKVKDLHPQLFSKLCNSLRVLNFAENKVKHIPPEIGSLRALRSLIMHSNRFSSLPCTIASLAKGSLEELSLEWFHYAKPPRLRLVKRGVTDGAEVFE
jgi:Leucine-rich repeat (LRR) protein